MEISIQSQDRKWEQVKVTDVFVTNEPELESVLILGQPWFQENAMKLDFPNKNLTLLNGTSCEVKLIENIREIEVVQGLLQGFSANSIEGENIEIIDNKPPNSAPAELAHLLYQASKARKKSIKAKQEEILSWGRYSEKYEDRFIKLISENKNLKDKTARTQIYNEMKPYLTGISDEYLRKITSKARKILKLFGWEYDTITQEKVNGIGWHMVKQVTYSADTISRLTNIEIQYIIDQVTSAQVGMTVSKTVNTVHDQELKLTENEMSISDIEASPNNTTQIFSHEDVSPIVAGTSGTSGTTAKYKGVEIFENAPLLRTELSSGSSSAPSKIWVKHGDSRPSKVVFDGGDVDDLIRAIKKELSNKLSDIDADITLRRHGEKEDLRHGLPVDKSFENNDDTPLQVIVSEPEVLSEIVKSAVREEFSRQKHANQVRVSNLSETNMNEIMNNLGVKVAELIDEDFQSLSPVSCQPFIWDMEREEAQQMRNVEIWFKNTLDLPRGFHVKDIHTQANYQRPLQGANVVLTGGSDVSIGPSGTACVWIKAKKTKEDFKEGQAIGELLLLDNLHSISSMVVLTDCNAHWIIFFFIKMDDEQNMATCRTHNPGIALAIIKQFVLEEGKRFHSWIGKTVDYGVDLLTPLQKKTKFTEHIPGADYENRMADMVGDMSEQELFNMTARKKLTMLRNWCKLDEQPQVDQLIRQFSDDYENPPPLMFI
ncbi:3290_t:CDS:2 [Acaulospora colombiana]|uniref:3290_t:CDS:1 n=1 Tax=Acaulospora colombiana TaxID=27376 RepID=A0ACA9L3R7_9GLOM|nr:3290_t:CDS:2 [Acaulospora colombiana]